MDKPKPCPQCGREWSDEGWYWYAFRERNGEIDFDSIADTPENVRLRYLEMCMGWRFGHPDRYDQDAEWERLLTYGAVVPVRVLVVDTSKGATDG